MDVGIPLGRVSVGNSFDRRYDVRIPLRMMNDTDPGLNLSQNLLDTAQ